MASISMLHVRIDDELKTGASEMLGRTGLSMSDAVRMLLRRVVDDQRCPRR
ncbi:MAG: type II toxin-antitoxin system RelB/DinJ family antitoxin [Sphingomonadaceae bacterium]|nr:type II toxin-antitoxin system RelB/DinJ family antitoxin [Sphingomonadaceae bacterium]